MAATLQKLINKSVAGTCACKEARNVYFTTLLESWTARYSPGNLKNEVSQIVSTIRTEGLNVGQVRSGALLSLQLCVFFWIGKAFGQGSISGVRIKIPAGRNEH